MSRAKIVVAACVASLALIAVNSASASAAGWFVNKAALASEAPAELAKATTTLSNYELNLLNNQIKVTCTGLQNNEAFIVGTNLFKAKSLSFTGCTSNAVNCPIEPTITTTAVRGAVVSGTPDTIKIEPVAGSTALLAVVEFTGPLCALSELPVKGNFTESSSDLGTEQLEHQLTVSASELKSASDTDTLTGSSDFKLATSGNTWSFH
ncbi:MAG: hypothetical protein WBV85_00280 [Solirubrobacteraceae bacterium]